MPPSQMRYQTVTCITDLGHNDESVGLIHSILHDRCDSPTVIDLCHHIDPGDAKAAALMLARSVPHLAPGVVLASVGRRLDRPAIAVQVGEGQAVLVGPDNGVLAAAVATVGGADLAVRLAMAGDPAGTADDTPDDTADGDPGQPDGDDPAAAIHPARDVLAPAVARICNGEPLESLGDPIDPAALLPSVLAMPRFEDDSTLVAEVLSVDNSGVAQLNIDRLVLAELAAPEQLLTLSFGDEQRLTTLAAPTDLAADLSDQSQSAKAHAVLAHALAGDASSEQSAAFEAGPAPPIPVEITQAHAAAGSAGQGGSGSAAGAAAGSESRSASAVAAPGRLILTDDIHAMLEVIVGGQETAADIGLAVGTEVRIREAK